MISPKAQIHESCKVWFPELSNIGACQIGSNGSIHSHVWIGNDVVIGNGVSIQAFTFIPEWVTIGNNVFLGPRVTFTNDKKPPSYGKHWARTIVEDCVSFGAGAIILPGVTLGEGCIIGAGAVVTKNVPPGETWIGNPAKQALSRVLA